MYLNRYLRIIVGLRKLWNNVGLCFARLHLGLSILIYDIDRSIFKVTYIYNSFQRLLMSSIF